MRNLVIGFLILFKILNPIVLHAQSSKKFTCKTAGELMAADLGASQFQKICKKIVTKDPACKKISAVKRMDCSSKSDNEIFSSKQLSNKAFACMKGFLWDSMAELGEFVFDLIKLIVNSHVNSVRSMYKFLTDESFRRKAIAAAGKKIPHVSKLSKAFLNSSALYFSREFSKNLKANPSNPGLALGKTLMEPLVRFMSEAVQSMIAEYVPQYQCMNSSAKLNTFCKLAGGLVMPPALVIIYIKYGVKGLKALSKSPKVIKFKKSFSKMNEVSSPVDEAKSFPLEVQSVPKAKSLPKSDFKLEPVPAQVAQTELKSGGIIAEATEAEAIELSNPKLFQNREKISSSNHHKNLAQQYEAKSYPVLDNGPRESQSFERVPTILEGNFRPKLDDLVSNESTVMLKPSGKAIIYDGQEYFEFPNSTALKVKSTEGAEKEFIFTRGVRKYETKINLEDGTISPQGYVSDVLLFEIKDGKPHFVNTIMKSSPETNFLFEDPRISVLYEKDGAMKVYLSGTDYSPHVAGSNNPDVMNRYVQLTIDSKGIPQPIKINKDTKRPEFLDLSPKPFKAQNGDMVYFDAKNATISRNESNQIVVRTRLRPDFGNPYFKEVTRGETWKYAEQVFVFDNYDDLKKYDWKYALEDLYDKNLNAPSGRLKPKAAKTLIKDKDLPELYKSEKVIEAKGKGMGPGTIPVRVRRQGNTLYVSDGVNAPETIAGIIPADKLITFPVKSGDVKFVAFDHEIRYFKDDRGGSNFIKRHYTASVKLFDDSLTKIDGYYSDVIQPKTLHEIGDNAGIADLQHVYPMGRTLNTKKGVTKVTVYGGASDAHTTAYDFDLIKLLSEMATDSPRRAAGQVR